jgi:hypothetical protein
LREKKGKKKKVVGKKKSDFAGDRTRSASKVDSKIFFNFDDTKKKVPGWGHLG